ncbi:MAG TPA: hypothetical protein VFU31_20945 [Candidatus Binatia bacterium]|nr:hypothetical protein [Candidatus Binatia bacterium]
MKDDDHITQVAFDTRPFEVHIPNLEGTATARTFTIQVPVRIEDGVEILTPEAHKNIAAAKFPEFAKMVVELRAREKRLRGALERIARSHPARSDLRFAAEDLRQFAQQALADAEKGEA